MPPKRKENAVEATNGANEAAEPRRSGRDRKQPVYNEDDDEPAKKPRAKKAKTDDNDVAEKDAATEKEPATEKDELKDGENGQDAPAASGVLSVGESIDTGVQLVTDEGKEVVVKDLMGEKGLVALLYPKANTPGCTTQACAFRDEHASFEKAGFKVYGLSMDGPKALANWKEKHSFNYTLLSDPKQALIKVLGGSKGKGVSRSHFVIDASGKILLAAIGVKPAESTKAAKAFVEAL